MRIKIYYNQLLCGIITFDDIPKKYQEDVKNMARADVEAGKMPLSQYEDLFGEPY